MPKYLKLNIDAKRIYGLDILRALAIIFVIISHGQYLLPRNFRPIERFITFDGVSIFFVLSGFLIGGILIKILELNGPTFKNLFNFWIRRWFRTLPNYFLILSILVILNLLFVEDFQFKRTINYFFFSQNLINPHPNFFPEAWSLSIEEWFYLVIPIVVFLIIPFFKASTKKSIIITSVGVLIFITFFRYFRFLHIQIENFYEWDLMYRKQVFTRLDSLMFGVIGAYFKNYYSEQWVKHKGKLLILGIFLFIISKILKILELYSFDGLYSCVFSFSLISLSTLLLLPFLSNLKKGSGFIFKILTYISLISYSMYLVHLSLVQNWIVLEVKSSLSLDSFFWDIFQFILFWFLTILFSIILYKYFELPIMKIRDKFN